MEELGCHVFVGFCILMLLVVVEHPAAAALLCSCAGLLLPGFSLEFLLANHPVFATGGTELHAKGLVKWCQPVSEVYDETGLDVEPLAGGPGAGAWGHEQSVPAAYLGFLLMGLASLLLLSQLLFQLIHLVEEEEEEEEELFQASPPPEELLGPLCTALHGEVS